MFETVEVGNKFANWADKIKEAWAKADFTEIGETLGNKLNAALSSINWSKVQSTANRIAKSIAIWKRLREWIFFRATKISQSTKANCDIGCGAFRCLSHIKKDIICFSEVRVEPSHPRKRLVASRSVASAFTSEQQRHSVTFFGKGYAAE